jgi:2-polyprenyl-3-methyl-5-hydroxy-6-metoxy-1,4-benzoquinol methylase
MKRLGNTPELLDGPLDAELLAGNLRDLARVNRWLGGARLSLDAILPFGRGQSGHALMRLLDVGTGAGDIPLYLARATAKRKPRLEITATDIRPEIVAIAASNVRETRINTLVGRIEDEADASFDLVHASMVVHHLEPVAAGLFMGNLGRVARVAVVVNDLDRGWRWLIGAWIMTRLFTRNAYTRRDAPLSVRRAYTADELVDIAHEAGLHPVAQYRAWPGYRYSIVFIADATGSA